MKKTIRDPYEAAWVIDIPDDDAEALEEVLAFLEEDARRVQNAERRERFHAPYHLEALDYESGSLAYHLTPEKLLLQKEQEEEHALALNALTETQRRRFCLWVDGLTYREIAAIEEADLSSVAESISTARKKLKKLL